MIQEGISDHEKTATHEVPCPYFKDHKKVFYWAIGALAGALLIVSQIVMDDTREAKSETAKAALDIVQMKADISYIRERVGEISLSMRERK